MCYQLEGHGTSQSKTLVNSWKRDDWWVRDWSPAEAWSMRAIAHHKAHWHPGWGWEAALRKCKWSAWKRPRLPGCEPFPAGEMCQAATLTSPLPEWKPAPQSGPKSEHTRTHTCAWKKKWTVEKGKGKGIEHMISILYLSQQEIKVFCLMLRNQEWETQANQWKHGHELNRSKVFSINEEIEGKLAGRTLTIFM